MLTCFVLYLATVVFDFRANPLHATRLDTIVLIRFDFHNTAPIRVMDLRQKSCALELLMRSCREFEAQT